MPSQLGFFGTHQPLKFAARARNGRLLVRAVSSIDPNSTWSGGIVRGGDYVTYTPTSDPSGYSVKLTADGFADIASSFDTSRQMYLAENYSRRLQMWTGDAEQYVNNHAPVGTLFDLQLAALVPMQPIVLLQLFTDFEFDYLVLVAIGGAFPPGTSVDGNVLSGIPSNLAGSGAFEVTARDVAGDVGYAQVNWTVHAIPIDAGSATEEQRLKTRVHGALTG